MAPAFCETLPELLWVESLQRVLASLGPPSTSSQVQLVCQMVNVLNWTCIYRHGTSSVDNLSDLEESRVKSVLFDSLEKFIAGQEDVQSVFSSLTESDTPPAVCGHVFKPGGKIF